ncbi:MAG: BrnT family toxin, partial [Nitrospirales bacterium]
WDDPDRLEVPARTQQEKRLVLIGKIADSSWSAVFTLRGEKTRIISVRRARKQEVEAYES